MCYHLGYLVLHKKDCTLADLFEKEDLVLKIIASEKFVYQ